MSMPSLGYKLVILGECTVGKSSIMNKFAKNSFIDNNETTIGAAFMVKSILIGDREVKFEIWDTAGQERYRSLAPVYYRGAEAAVIVYDVTNKDSFYKAKLWVDELHRKSKNLNIIALVGNKMDLDDKEVEAECGREYADEEKLIFLETSAKTGHNIYNLFSQIAERLPLKKDNFPNNKSNEISKSIKLPNYIAPDVPKRKKCC